MIHRHVFLVCDADGDCPESQIREVHADGGTVVLGQVVFCTTDDQRVRLALDKGFATRAERDNARVESVVFEPRPRGWFSRWVVTFDMAGYQALLDRL